MASLRGSALDGWGDKRVGCWMRSLGDVQEEHFCDVPTAPGLGGREIGSVCTGPLWRQKANVKNGNTWPKGLAPPGLGYPVSPGFIYDLIERELQ